MQVAGSETASCLPTHVSGLSSRGALSGSSLVKLTGCLFPGGPDKPLGATSTRTSTFRSNCTSIWQQVISPTFAPSVLTPVLVTKSTRSPTQIGFTKSQPILLGGAPAEQDHCSRPVNRACTP